MGEESFLGCDTVTGQNSRSEKPTFKRIFFGWYRSTAGDLGKRSIKLCYGNIIEESVKSCSLIDPDV